MPNSDPNPTPDAAASGTHTPGPWTVENVAGRFYVASEHQHTSTFGTICDLYCRNDSPTGFFAFPNAEANAKLIASAPDMASRIAALEGALKIIRHEHESDDGHFCRLCGAAGGRWPCSTRLEAVAALASPARAEVRP